MASTYTKPNDYLVWFIRGDNLAILTSKFDTNTNPNSHYVAIDESVTNGILINYLAEPDAVTAVTDYPDIDNTLHKYIVDFVKAEFYMEEAGKAAMEGNDTKSVLLERLAMRHEKRWTNELVKFGVSKRDKVGGSRYLMPLDYR